MLKNRLAPAKTSSAKAYALGGLALAALLLAGCSGDADTPVMKKSLSAQNTQSAASTPVLVEAVLLRSAAQTTALVGTGMLERERELTLSFRIPGAVTKLTVDAGDLVARGQIIAEIDASAIDARVRQASADLEKANRDLERDRVLAAQGWVSAQRFADRQTSAQMAQATLDTAQFDRRYAVLRAPTSGVVLVRHMQAGEVMAPGQPVITMGDATSPFVVRVPFADRAVARLALGDKANVRISALPNRLFAGQITRIDPRADPRTGAFDVDIRLPNAAGLKTGFVADVEIIKQNQTPSQTPSQTPTQPPALARIPAEAIIAVNGSRALVYLVDEAQKRAKAMNVVFQGFDGDDALVLGLPASGRVITTGGGYVKDGSLLTLVGQSG
jgi:RND family efflux transporter MFP subunit